MTRKVIRNAHPLGLITLLFGVLTILIAVAVPAQTRRAGQVSDRNGSVDRAMDIGPLLFVPAIAYDSGGYTATSVAVGDLNGDGKLDLVVGNRCANSGCQSGHGSVGVLLGNGDGTFQPAVAYDSGGGPHFFHEEAVAVADLNGDHKPDIVVTNAGSNTVGVLLGNGNGTFQAAVTYGSGGMFLSSVAVADVNGDGRTDLLVTNACSDPNCDGTVGALLGNGNGTFQAAVTYGSGGILAQSVAVADVNHDGKADLLVANDCAGSCSKIKGGVAVLLGNGDGTFQTATSYDSGGSHAYSVAAADVNGDGSPDLQVSHQFFDRVGVLLGNGDGSFQPAVTYSSDAGAAASAVSVGVADVDGDGKPDLLVVNLSLGGNSNNGGAVAVLLGNGDGTFQAAVNYASGGYQALGFAVGDVNGDGRTDLLVANSCSSSSGEDCAGPINKITGSVGVLLNNVGAPPTTTAVVSSVNPAAVNWVVTYTATVTSQSGGVLKGTVLFRDGAAPIATVTLAGNQAAYSTTYAVKGTHSITATYSGRLNKAAGSTSDVLTEIILQPRPTKTQVTTSGSPSLVGQPVTFRAVVTSTYGAIPNGELVTFYDGTVVIGTNTTASGMATFTTSSLTAKTHTIKATYSGDAGFKPSTGSVVQVVEKFATTTGLTSSPNPSQFGQVVTFTAHVNSPGPAPTGKVRFFDGTTGIGTVTVSGGIAKLHKSTLAVGTHAITAQYLGDAVSAKSTSSVVNQVVQ